MTKDWDGSVAWSSPTQRTEHTGNENKHKLKQDGEGAKKIILYRLSLSVSCLLFGLLGQLMTNDIGTSNPRCGRSFAGCLLSAPQPRSLRGGVFVDIAVAKI